MDEKLKILKMVEAGTVTAQQAADMMAEADQAESRSIELPPGYDCKLFRITVDGAQGDKVNNKSRILWRLCRTNQSLDYVTQITRL